MTTHAVDLENSLVAFGQSEKEIVNSMSNNTYCSQLTGANTICSILQYLATFFSY